MSRLSPIAARLPASLQIVLADIGSAGGLHRRWTPIRANVSAVLFDPLDQSVGSERDRYFPVAVAEGPGQTRIHVTKRVSMTSSLLPNKPLLARFWDKPDHTEIVSTLDVPTDSLDRVMETNGIALDVIKIDVQGGEFAILSGARKSLASSICLAEVEVSFLERYFGLRTFDAVIGLMRESGFELIDVSRIKRYRHKNSFGVINPGLGMGDRAGRIAFCDALFIKSDERLMEQISAGDDTLPLKIILALLVYGKADFAAWMFDRVRERIDGSLRKPLEALFKSLRGRRVGASGLHRAVDYFARKV
jgi:FkbM family methyltransferase